MGEPRLLIDDALKPGAVLALDDAQARHVGGVLRLDVGDALRVFNAADGEWRARVGEKTKRGMRITVTEFVRAARASPDLDLLFAPVKRHATDLIVEKATELGVRRIFPVTTQRTIAETVRVDRLSAIAREAAQQTERFDAPEIYEAQSLARALDGWDAARTLIYADEAGDDASAPWGGEAGRARDIARVMQTLRSSPLVGEVSRGSATEGGSGGARARENTAVTPTPNPAPKERFLGGGESLALLIGPEGGFTTEERRMLRGFSFVIPVSLGPRILRAETAVIAALSVIQATWGDWREP